MDVKRAGNEHRTIRNALPQSPHHRHTNKRDSSSSPKDDKNGRRWTGFFARRARRRARSWWPVSAAQARGVSPAEQRAVNIASSSYRKEDEGKGPGAQVKLNPSPARTNNSATQHAGIDPSGAPNLVGGCRCDQRLDAGSVTATGRPMEAVHALGGRHHGQGVPGRTPTDGCPHPGTWAEQGASMECLKPAPPLPQQDLQARQAGVAIQMRRHLDRSHAVFIARGKHWPCEWLSTDQRVGWF